MKGSILRFVVCQLLAVASVRVASSQDAGPVFEDGQAQVVDAFNDPKAWIREELWVETEFDCDGDRKLDRMHVAVVRPEQTESEGLKVPVIYESSPYYSPAPPAGISRIFWDVEARASVRTAAADAPASHRRASRAKARNRRLPTSMSGSLAWLRGGSLRSAGNRSLRRDARRWAVIRKRWRPKP